MASVPEKLFEDFQRTNRLIRRQVQTEKEQAAGEQFSPGQSRLLRILNQEAGISQKELAEKMRIRPASLSELLKKLEAKDYVFKEQNQQDRRINNFYLTPAGKEFAASLEEVQRNYGEKIFASLNHHELQQLAEILHKLNRSLEEPSS